MRVFRYLNDLNVPSLNSSSYLSHIDVQRPTYDLDIEEQWMWEVPRLESLQVRAVT